MYQKITAWGIFVIKKQSNWHKKHFSLYKQWYYLTVGIFSFSLFILTLPKGSTLAQDQITDPGVNLISENDQFEKMTPEDLKLNFPQYSPPPKNIDSRLIILKKYLTQFNSPLISHAQDFLDAADKYGVDWRLVPAIAGVESTFGKAIPGGHDPDSTSYNGWGWGVYGDKVLKFNSWREAIFAVTKGLKEGYLNKGLTDPLSMNKKYAASPFWADSLTYFLTDLDSFENLNPVPVPNTLIPPSELGGQIFQNYVYLKDEETHFSLQTAE